MVALWIVHNAAFTSSSRPSEGTSLCLGKWIQRVQVSTFVMILHFRSARLALSAPSFISPPRPDVLGFPCRSICVVSHQSPVVIAVLSSECWNTKLVVVSSSVWMSGIENSIGHTSSSCNLFRWGYFCSSIPTALFSSLATLCLLLPVAHFSSPDEDLQLSLSHSHLTNQHVFKQQYTLVFGGNTSPLTVLMTARVCEGVCWRQRDL